MDLVDRIGIALYPPTYIWVSCYLYAAGVWKSVLWPFVAFKPRRLWAKTCVGSIWQHYVVMIYCTVFTYSIFVFISSLLYTYIGPDEGSRFGPVELFITILISSLLTFPAYLPFGLILYLLSLLVEKIESRITRIA